MYILLRLFVQRDTYTDKRGYVSLVLFFVSMPHPRFAIVAIAIFLPALTTGIFLQSQHSLQASALRTVTACGDRACNGSETCSDCPADCGMCAAKCGNHICDFTESCSSCRKDCGSCTGTVIDPIPTRKPTVPPVAPVIPAPILPKPVPPAPVVVRTAVKPLPIAPPAPEPDSLDSFLSSGKKQFLDIMNSIRLALIYILTVLQAVTEYAAKFIVGLPGRIMSL
ncbi:MAG: uncharacterized protein JWM56_1382 [Candidatus Peribacteria bacterium]|nr:uncharacterized protein [Candidatus Peribacteria bacterium]